MTTASIVSRVWSFCTTLRDDGVGYGDYLEQLTYLIFLKMADEYAKPPCNRHDSVPEGRDPVSLATVRGEELEAYCFTLPHVLDQQRRMFGHNRTHQEAATA